MINKVIWNPQQLRATIFPIDDKFDNKKIWPTIKGLPIDRSVVDAKIGISNFEGLYFKNKLSLIVSPAKIDLTWEVLEPLTFGETETIHNCLAEFDESIENFKKLTKIWFSNKALPSLKRIAFGAILIKNVANREQGYKELLPFVPIKFESKDLSEFGLQINIHTKSKIIEKMDINRLTRWSVMRTKSEIFQFSQPTKISKANPDAYSLRLELDMSTQTDNQYPIKNNYKSFLELINFGLVISKEGIK